MERTSITHKTAEELADDFQIIVSSEEARFLSKAQNISGQKAKVLETAELLEEMVYKNLPKEQQVEILKNCRLTGAAFRQVMFLVCATKDQISHLKESAIVIEDQAITTNRVYDQISSLWTNTTTGITKFLSSKK